MKTKQNILGGLLLLGAILPEPILAEDICNGTTIILRITAEFLEQAVISASLSEKIVESSSAFNDTLNSLSVSASIEGSYAGFSAGASAAYDSVTEAVSSSSSNKEETSSSTTAFNPLFLQIYRVVTTKVTLKGRTAKLVEREFVDSVSIDKPKTAAELKKRGEDYITNTFGQLEGQIDGKTYTQTVCQIKPSMCTGYFIETDINDARNKKQRPPPGTSCVSSCIVDQGRWGSSYCNTERDGYQWGAECVPCAA